jgi:hypothetical protein
LQQELSEQHLPVIPQHESLPQNPRPSAQLLAPLAKGDIGTVLLASNPSKAFLATAGLSDGGLGAAFGGLRSAASGSLTFSCSGYSGSGSGIGDDFAWALLEELLGFAVLEDSEVLGSAGLEYVDEIFASLVVVDVSDE